jgi:predicted nucleotidyltransferase
MRIATLTSSSTSIQHCQYARLKLYIGELLGGTTDVVNRKTLKPLLREAILRDAVNAF